MLNDFVLLLALFGASSGQVMFDGPCPEIQVVQHFDSSAYLGTWFEQARYFAIFEVGTKCNLAEYSLLSNGSLSVLNKAIKQESGEPDKVEGFADFIGDSKEGRLAVTFPQHSEFVAIYSIIGTDYKNWAAVFSCTNVGKKANARFAWLLTRNRNPSEDVLNAAKNAFESQNIPIDKFLQVNHETCSEEMYH